MKSILWSLAAGVAVFLCGTIPVLPGPRWMKAPAFFLLSAEAFFVFPWIAALCFAPLAALMAIAKLDGKGEWRRKLGFALLLLLLIPVGVFAALPIRHARFEAAAARAVPLIAAIEAGRDDAATLASFSTGLMAYPEFRLKRAGKDDLFRRYELSIECSSGLLNWDRFVYWPESGYPGSMYGGGVERVGAWAYVHE